MDVTFWYFLIYAFTQKKRIHIRVNNKPEVLSKDLCMLQWLLPMLYGIVTADLKNTLNMIG